MTERELDDFHKLAKQIRVKEEQIRTFKKSIGVKSPGLTGMPHGTGISDRTAAIAIELEDLEVRLCCQKARYDELLPRITEFIDQIEDSDTRLVYRFRLLYGYSWQEVADILNCKGYHGKETVRKRYTRYLEKADIFIPKVQSWRDKQQSGESVEKLQRRAGSSRKAV